MGLQIDWITGEGSVTLPKRLAEADNLFRADVINNWIHDLKALRAEAFGEFMDEMEDVRIKAGYGPFKTHPWRGPDA